MFSNDREDDRHKAVEFGISFDGRSQHYREYLGDKLADPLNLAEREAARPNARTGSAVEPEWLAVQVHEPTAAEQVEMMELSITFDGRHYRYDDYYYERLADARQCALSSRMNINTGSG